MGKHQFTNAAIAVALAKYLEPDLTNEQINLALTRARWAGRAQIVGLKHTYLNKLANLGESRLYMDGAHTAQSVRVSNSKGEKSSCLLWQSHRRSTCSSPLTGTTKLVPREQSAGFSLLPPEDVMHHSYFDLYYKAISLEFFSPSIARTNNPIQGRPIGQLWHAMMI